MATRRWRRLQRQQGQPLHGYLQPQHGQVSRVRARLQQTRQNGSQLYTGSTHYYTPRGEFRGRRHQGRNCKMYIYKKNLKICVGPPFRSIHNLRRFKIPGLHKRFKIQPCRRTCLFRSDPNHKFLKVLRVRIKGEAHKE